MSKSTWSIMRASRAAMVIGVTPLVVIGVLSAGAGANPGQHPDLRSHTNAAAVGESQSALITSYSGTLTVPTVNCDGQETGITIYDVLGQRSNIHPYTQWDLNAGCRTAGGSPTYVVGVYVSTRRGTSPTETVQPGDILRLTYSTRAEAAGTLLISTLKDMTNGTNLRRTGMSSTAGVAGDYGASVYVNWDNNGDIIGQFTPVTFGQQTLNGTSLASLSPRRYQMYNEHTGALEAKVTTFTKRGTFKVEEVPPA